jgi:4-diphosphocytidyl-2-C-methyl-D-erythritol kinase
VWPAPAKLNLFLHILGRRQDGYHNLQTLFQLLDYGDELTFQLTDDTGITVSGNHEEIKPRDDLILKAAEALREHTGVRRGVSVIVTKRIPVGGGLGGGSSNAATTLVALNELWNTHLPVTQLAELGRRLGADLPVFVHGHTAWAEGTGDKLNPVQLPEDWFLVIHPGCRVSTAAVFNMPGLTRNSPAITIRDFYAGAVHNDCEPVVFREFPGVARAAAWLRQRTQARLTGTGSCVFGRFASENEALTVLDQLPPEWQGFVSRGRNISPLHDRLDLLRSTAKKSG